MSLSLQRESEQWVSQAFLPRAALASEGGSVHLPPRIANGPPGGGSGVGSDPAPPPLPPSLLPQTQSVRGVSASATRKLTASCTHGSALSAGVRLGCSWPPAPSLSPRPKPGPSLGQMTRGRQRTVQLSTWTRGQEVRGLAQGLAQFFCEGQRESKYFRLRGLRSAVTAQKRP